MNENVNQVNLILLSKSLFRPKPAKIFNFYLILAVKNWRMAKTLMTIT